MSGEMNTPGDDRDRRLARAIGDALDAGKAPNADADDREFLASLSELARAERDGLEEPSPDSTARMWKGIEERTSVPSRRATPGRRGSFDRPGARSRGTERPALERASRRFAWGGIVALLLVGMVATFLFVRDSGESLVAVASGEVVEYAASDGSIVILRPGSELYRTKRTEDELQFRLAGEGYFVVAERHDRVFRVIAGDALVEVLGTRFDLRSWGDGALVYLEEGSIRFSSRTTGHEVVLEPGQTSRLSGERPEAPTQADAEEFVDWLRGELVFNRRPAAEIAAEIAHHFGVEIDLPVSHGRETLTGRILLDEFETVLVDLGAAMGGSFVPTGTRTYRFEPN